MGHRHRHVGLVVDEASHSGDGPARDEFSDAHDGPAPRAILCPAPHVEPEIRFLEAAVARDGEAQEAGIEKAKAHETDEMAALPLVELGAQRNKWAQQRRVDDIVARWRGRPPQVGPKTRVRRRLCVDLDRHVVFTFARLPSPTSCRRSETRSDSDLSASVGCTGLACHEVSPAARPRVREVTTGPPGSILGLRAIQD